MSPSVAKKLLPLVNVNKHLDAVQGYALERVDFLYRQLEIATSIEEVKELQGSLKEARRLLTIREEAQQEARES